MADKRMNRTTKGIIAALLGAGLLGGFGTFALWSDSQQVSSGAITAGNLDLTVEGTPAWSDISPAGTEGWTGTDVFDSAKTGDAKPISQIADFLMVPGDLLEYQADVKVIATGDNMKAQLVVDPDSVAIPDGLDGHVTIAAELEDATGTQLGSAPIGDPITFAIDQPTPAAGANYSVKVRVGFDGTTPDQEGVTKQIDLSNMGIELNQVRS